MGATTRQNIQVNTGNRIAAEYGGVEVGLIDFLRGTDDYGLEPASGVGDIHVKEYYPTMARHTINAAHLVLKSKTLFSEGVGSMNGDAALLGTVFDIVCYSRDTQKILRKWINAAYGGGDIEIRRHAVVIANAVFHALDVAFDLSDPDAARPAGGVPVAA